MIKPLLPINNITAIPPKINNGQQSTRHLPLLLPLPRPQLSNISSPQLLLAKTSRGLSSINENIMVGVGLPILMPGDEITTPKPRTRGRKKKIIFDIVPQNGGDKLLTPIATPAPIKPKNKKSDSLKNILIVENMNEVMKEYDNVYGSDNHILTTLTPTIMTLCGRFSNVVLDESKDTELFKYDDRIIRIYSNYGESVNPFYVEPPKIKSKRGRKPKEQKIKRKPQGFGTSFNSQITFVVRTNNMKTYNIKVFRDGGFCISGGEGIEYITDVIKCLNTVASKIELVMSIKNKIEIEALRICMKNYKCQVKLKDRQIVDVLSLKNKLIPDDQIKDVKFDVETSLLIITFTYGSKKITVKLFPKSGKINILGSKEYARVVEIYDYLSKFISANPEIIVTEGELT